MSVAVAESVRSVPCNGNGDACHRGDPRHSRKTSRQGDLTTPEPDLGASLLVAERLAAYIFDNGFARVAKPDDIDPLICARV
jgi:hypothetical protein